MRRPPAVAGQFYPGTSSALRQMLGELIPVGISPRAAVGMMVPHAGFIYSGAIAGETFSQVSIPETVVILGPNHQGVGPSASIYSEGSWRTPLGETSIDRPLAHLLIEEVPWLQPDASAHRFEHSLEVQLPFIQYLSPESTIVPICLSSNRLDHLLSIGESIGGALRGREDVLMVASTDMSHYERGDVARKKDLEALDRVLSLDPEGLYRTVAEKRISMCGVVPVVVMLSAARRLGARKATLVRYGNSGDVTGDQSQVVGYAGAIVEKG